jgi:hypothetical protein
MDLTSMRAGRGGGAAFRFTVAAFVTLLRGKEAFTLSHLGSSSAEPRKSAAGERERQCGSIFRLAYPKREVFHFAQWSSINPLVYRKETPPPLRCYAMLLRKVYSRERRDFFLVSVSPENRKRFKSLGEKKFKPGINLSVACDEHHRSAL